MTDQTAVRTPGHVLTDWRPEDASFWAESGKRAARRNLWISIPALLLSFAVWMVWSVVVVNLPAIGFAFDTGQLFWLAALPGLSGATLRLFYSFMVPIFGGRAWTTLSTASLLLPALGIGIAVQDPATPYSVFLVLALLCGFGGGNFASSMSNISFFFPKAQKGMALGLNAGLGNLGVSVVQFVVPLVITAPRQVRRVLGLPRDVHGPVRGVRGRQLLNLPDDPGDLPDAAPARQRHGRRGGGQGGGGSVARGGGGPGLHLGYRGLRRLLHSQAVRHLDLADRQPGPGAGDLHRLLSELHRLHLVVLHPPGRGGAVLRRGRKRDRSGGVRGSAARLDPQFGFGAPMRTGHAPAEGMARCDLKRRDPDCMTHRPELN
ncbi:MFS transporter [Skermanella rosea]|uniref:hypothetical protein n=1 Tax=Skermanella rosea TaxID=1817965 RepID=UPI002B214943|nr:hypothetical protein [Skermanella rosea]